MRPPICIDCRVETKLLDIGYDIKYENANGSGEIIAADIHQCPKCGHKVAAGFANQPFGRHFEDDYARKVEASELSGKLIRVKELV